MVSEPAADCNTIFGGLKNNFCAARPAALRHNARRQKYFMHEFGIMEAALETAAQKTRAAGATQIHRLKLRVGKLSGVVPEALRFAFDALKAGSPAASAVLEIEEVPAVCWCADCAAEFEAADLNYECPRCHRPSGELRRGKEMELASLEIS